MKKLSTMKGKFIIFLSIFLITPFIIKFYNNHNKKTCDIVIILQDNKKINCNYFQDYVSGVTRIRTCDDTDIIIKTSEINQVVSK
jgi:hypothetical protein